MSLSVSLYLANRETAERLIAKSIVYMHIKNIQRERKRERGGESDTQGERYTNTYIYTETQGVIDNFVA